MSRWKTRGQGGRGRVRGGDPRPIPALTRTRPVAPRSQRRRRRNIKNLQEGTRKLRRGTTKASFDSFGIDAKEPTLLGSFHTERHELYTRTISVSSWFTLPLKWYYSQQAARYEYKPHVLPEWFTSSMVQFTLNN